MCKYLDPACFMANVFIVCEDRESMDFATLRTVRDHVTTKLADQNVVIEWTRDSVMGAVESYPNLFQVADRQVIWRKARDKEAVKRSFDGDFSDKFIGDLWHAIQEGCKDGRTADCSAAGG